MRCRTQRRKDGVHFAQPVGEVCARVCVSLYPRPRLLACVPVGFGWVN